MIDRGVTGKSQGETNDTPASFQEQKSAATSVNTGTFTFLSQQTLLLQQQLQITFVLHFELQGVTASCWLCFSCIMFRFYNMKV